jgi:cation diffusion facilitator family transporter
MKADLKTPAPLIRFAWLSIAAAIATIVLKTIAYFLTGSVGLLSDALESLVNLAGALMALAMLTVASRPADDEHAYGHSKAEYFSSGVEGTLILIAALCIGVVSVERLIEPRELEQVGLGLGVSVLASLVNLVVAVVLRQAAKKHGSITLEANARHLMTDVWTTAGVLVGVGAVGLTGWTRLDPLIAIVVAANIVWTGVKIIRSSALGLMDTALPKDEVEKVGAVLDKFSSLGIQYHALRTRQAGVRRFVSLHVLVPGGWTVHQGHHLLERIEEEIRGAIPNSTVFTHLESLEDPSSWDDMTLDRSRKV